MPLVLLAGASAFAQSAPPGAKAFQDRCAPCHGLDGRGGERAPAARPGGRSDQGLRDLIHNGLPARGMPGFDLPDSTLQEVIRFLKTIPSSTGPKTDTSRDWPNVSFDDLAHPKPGEWPSYHGQLSGNRHSDLRAIDKDNVKDLANAVVVQHSRSGKAAGNAHRCRWRDVRHHGQPVFCTRCAKRKTAGGTAGRSRRASRGMRPEPSIVESQWPATGSSWSPITHT